MNKTLGPAPGFQRHPDHRMELVPAADLWTARINGEGIASSRGTIVVHETGYSPVVYFPAADVRQDTLQESDSRTTCPFKGEARYLAADIGGHIMDVAWTYPLVYEEAAPIAGYIAFYPDHVNVARFATTQDSKSIAKTPQE